MTLLGFSGARLLFFPTAFRVLACPSAGRRMQGRESKVLRGTPSSSPGQLRDLGVLSAISASVSRCVKWPC